MQVPLTVRCTPNNSIAGVPLDRFAALLSAAPGVSGERG